MIVIIDYHVGNLKSVLNAMQRSGIEAIVSRDHEVIEKADGIILPGVGTFPVAMNHLQEFDLIPILKERVAAGIPMLGICLGMQILFELGYEVEKTNGLGFLHGEVKKIPYEVKLPHMGWNQLLFHHQHPILRYMQENDYVYFVHSYMAFPYDEELVAYCEYGGGKIPAIVAHKNVVGCQFHPEKSGRVGKKIIEAFKEMVG